MKTISDRIDRFFTFPKSFYSDYFHVEYDPIFAFSYACVKRFQLHRRIVIFKNTSTQYKNSTNSLAISTVV